MKKLILGLGVFFGGMLGICTTLFVMGINGICDGDFLRRAMFDDWAIPYIVCASLMVFGLIVACIGAHGKD